MTGAPVDRHAQRGPAAPSTLQVLTVAEPYASALVNGPKRVENRTWRPPLSTRLPMLLGIHAAAGPFERRAPSELVTELRPLWPRIPPPERWPFRELLGVVLVTGFEEFDERNPAHANDPWASGPWLWRVGLARSLAPHQRYTLKGRLGLWSVDVPPGSPLAEVCADLLASHAGGGAWPHNQRLD